MASAARRRDMDMMKLMMSDYDVQAEDDGKYEFVVNFHGPSETPYEGGTWQVAVALPAQYPFKSPSISFRNRMFHPNVDERSGSVCLDVINQTWSPMFDLVNVFDVFLPQLLRYPNPTDPLNGEAAALLLREPETYAARIKEYVVRYAGGAKTSAAAAKAKAAAAEAASAAAAAASASSSSSSSSSSTTSNRSRSESASSAVSTSVDDSMSKDDSDSADGGVSEADDDEEDDDDMSVVSDISELSDM